MRRQAAAPRAAPEPGTASTGMRGQAAATSLRRSRRMIRRAHAAWAEAASLSLQGLRCRAAIQGR